jgi:hypothetical protein
MRQMKRWRYYCDHCKKSGGRGPDMLRHELRCTLNPARSCRVCEIGGLSPAPLAELVVLAKSLGDESNTIPEAELKKLSDAADGCPGCILAAHRQAGVHSTFDFKKAMEPIWEEINAERWSIVGGAMKCDEYWKVKPVERKGG